MADDDIRTRRLEWIRDGSVWLVGLSSGALVLSITYFFDKFKQHPRASCLLFSAWGLLLLAAGAGVFTAFSTWKDLKPFPQPPTGGSTDTVDELPLGGWVANCYTIMMWSFLFGFVFLVIALLINVVRPMSQPDRQTIELTVPANVQIQITAKPSQPKQILQRSPLPIDPAPVTTNLSPNRP
jgi:Na+-transporting methylmalonyl-CoA/oxaloacetate decarboxylase gamma subunit